MEEARITVTIKPIMIERVIYWILIVLLAILLLLSYLTGDEDGTANVAAAVSVEQANNLVDDADALLSELSNSNAAAVQNLKTEVEALKKLLDKDKKDIDKLDDQIEKTGALLLAARKEVADVLKETLPGENCVDGVKNQDETDVDCGGSKCGGCAADKACTTASDCAGDFCIDNKCTNDNPDLTGELSIKITGVEYDKSPSSTIKVTGVDYELTNGLDEDFSGFLLKVFIKNKAGTRCLNQQTSGSCDDSYAELLLPGVRSGKTSIDGADFTDSHYTTKMGRFLILDNGYDPEDSGDDDFSVFIYLYDESGNLINAKTISTFKTVNPT